MKNNNQKSLEDSVKEERLLPIGPKGENVLFVAHLASYLTMAAALAFSIGSYKCRKNVPGEYEAIYQECKTRQEFRERINDNPEYLRLFHKENKYIGGMVASIFTTIALGMPYIAAQSVKKDNARKLEK